MTSFEPRSVSLDGVLRVQLCDAQVARSFELDCVLDETYLGDVVGIEILDLKRQLPGDITLPRRAEGGSMFAYDEEVDALYIHISEGRGQVQNRSSATVRLDPLGQIVGFEIPVPRVF